MRRFDAVAIGSAIAIAALLRLPGIEARGRFDADQGHDMLTLLAFTRDGVIPLLGPRTSVGEFHHGALYYFVLAPAAAVSNADPVVVTAFLALLGIAAVALTWWLGRSIGGPVAGAIAGLLAAVSPAAIEQSTFIWNPNPIGFFAVLSLAAAWRARSGGDRGWWVVAVGAAGAVVQMHVLGVVFFAAILAIVVLQLLRDRAVLGPLAAGLAVVAFLFVPLLAHELQTGFLETQRVLEYLRGGDAPLAANPVASIAFTLLRVVGWPLVGLVTDVAILASVLLALTLGAALLALRVVPAPASTAVRWLVGTLLWSTLALAFAAPSLQRVVAGLPNDHYHAFLDPVVILLLAVPAGILFERAAAALRSARGPTPALVAAAIGIVVITVFTAAVLRKPPRVDPDGGWPAMRDAAARIMASTGSPVVLIGLPPFKSTDAVAFPIVRAGGEVLAGPPGAGDSVVVVCDRLFETAMGLPCGGPAEAVAVVGLESGGLGPYRLVEQWDVAPFARTSISVYEPAAAP